VYLGEEKRHWTLHANLLSFHSEYLQKELAQQWDSRGGSNDKPDSNPGLRLDLPEHEPKGFELLVKWFYQGRLDDVVDMRDPQEKYDHAAACQRLYALCEQFGITSLMNQAMDQYRKGLRDAGLVPDAGEMSDIYSRSHIGSPFRTLMTRIAARQIMDPDSDKDAVDYRECFASSPDFAIQLINAIKRDTGGLELGDPTEAEGCDYHLHAPDMICYFERKGLWIISTEASDEE
jgi:BTB/POZ domain